MPNSLASIQVPPAFLRHVSVTLDFEGRHLTARACINDRCFEKTIDLLPLTNFIAEQMRAYHAELHGDDQISGITDFLAKAGSAAKKIATSSAVKQVYQAAAPVLKVIPVAGQVVNYAELGHKIASKTYDVVKAAKKGDPKAIGQLATAINKAKEGSPLAQQVVQTAKTLSNMHDMKNGKDPTELASRLASIERTLAPLHRVSGEDEYEIGSLLSKLKSKAKYLVPGLSEYHMMKNTAKLAKKHLPKAVTSKAKYLVPGLSEYHTMKNTLGFAKSKLKPSNARGQAPAFSRPHAPPPPSVNRPGQDHPTVTDIVEPHEQILATDDGVESFDISMPGEETYSEDQYSGYDLIGEDYGEVDVAGWRDWAYSRPYRTPIQAAAQGDFGASTTLRSLYSSGMARILNR